MKMLNFKCVYKNNFYIYDYQKQVKRSNNKISA